MKIVADEHIPFLRGVLEPYSDVIYLPGKEIDRAIVKDADALLIRTRTKCVDKLLRGSKVSFIGTATIGFDHIDTRYCVKNNIFWTNAPGCNSTSVQQYITTALLKIASDFRFSLKDKTIGIVGVGNVGSKVEKVARALGMKVLLNDPPRARKEGSEKFVLLGNILYEADIITVHVPLNVVGEDKTYHLFNDRSFRKMKKGTWFLNTSRGEVTETSALKKALDAGKLAGAVVDVWENEPDLDLDLMSKAFIATPHIAGYSTDGKANGTAMVVNSLCSKFGLPLKDWYPHDIPMPSKPVIKVAAKDKSEEDIVRELVFHTYDISSDDMKLRFSPSDFEKQRGEYPSRREFSAYAVELTGGTAKLRKIIEDLGFRLSGK